VKPERLSSRNSSDYADRFLNNVRNQILKPTYDQNSGNFIEDQTKKLIEHFNRRFSHKQMDDLETLQILTSNLTSQEK